MVIYVKYITYEGILHNTLALDVDTVQEQTRVSRMRRHCVNGFDFRNLFKRNVVRTSALEEVNSDWLNRFSRTRVSDNSLNCFY